MFRKLFRTKAEPEPPTRKQSVQLAFVLLPEPRLPSAESLSEQFSRFAPSDRLILFEGPDSDNDSDEALTFQFESEGMAFVALMPAAVPNREADEGAQFSVSSLGTGWALPDHQAHVVVSALPSGGLTPLEQLSRFTSLLAGIAKATDAIGVYWGGAGATHDPNFFVEVAAEPGTVPRIMLWSGLSVAREEDGRLSLLSLGMQQLDLPDLLLVASPESEGEALEFFFDMLGYLAELGAPLPEGNTVGRTAEERLPVSYVPSPIDQTKSVWRVDLP